LVVSETSLTFEFLTNNMKQSFTKDFMRENCGCYSIAELEACSFMKNDEISLQSILQSEIPLKDKFWFLCYKLATKEENQEMAIRVAEIVLPIYERIYPDNKTPREAIEAAKQYIRGNISLDELAEKRRAVYYTADYAALAAYYAAKAATMASYAAAYAAAYDAAIRVADYDAKIKQQLEDYLLTFVEN
jgi:hypothetical protein